MQSFFPGAPPNKHVFWRVSIGDRIHSSPPLHIIQTLFHNRILFCTVRHAGTLQSRCRRAGGPCELQFLQAGSMASYEEKLDQLIDKRNPNALVKGEQWPDLLYEKGYPSYKGGIK